MPTLSRLPQNIPVPLLAIAGATLCFALALAVPKRATAKDEKPAAPTPALTVTTGQPSTTTLPVGLTANGSVAAWQEALIGSESNGLRLSEVRVNVGDVVKKGETLAVFASETVRADVEQARAALQEAQANASAAKADADRARALRSSGALSEQQVTQLLTAERTAAARVSASRATLAQQELRLRQATVVAPDSGIISSRSATVGAVTGPGTELFRMIRQGRLEWRAEVTSNDLGRIKPGMRAAVRAASGSEIVGKVRTVAPTVDPQTRLALVYIDLPPSLSANAPLKAGMFASGRFELGATSALTVPQQAVAVRDGFSYLFRLNGDNRVSQLKVSTGRRLGDRVEIVGGLAAGTPIVISGAGFLNDGDLVRNVQPPAAPAKAAPATGPRQTAAR